MISGIFIIYPKKSPLFNNKDSKKHWHIENKLISDQEPPKQ